MGYMGLFIFRMLLFVTLNCLKSAVAEFYFMLAKTFIAVAALVIGNLKVAGGALFTPRQ